MWVLLYWLTLLLFLATAAFLLHIPLPSDISDRRKLQILELVLRIGCDYPGDLIEYLFGARVRNSYMRLFLAIGYILPWPSPNFLKITVERIGGTSVRVYTPHKKKSRAALVFIHGGGWSLMRAAYYDQLMGAFVRRLGVTLFSIDYRLAPEYPFPYPVEDCEAVIRDLYYNSYKRFDIDQEKICVFGDSAGGNLTAVVTQRLARQNEHIIKCQVLIYPVIHVFGFHLPSYVDYYKKYNGTALLNPRAMARWILQYLGLPGDKCNVEVLLGNRHISEKIASSPKMKTLIGDTISPARKAVTTSNQLSQDYEVLLRTFSTIGIDPDVSPLLGVRKDLPPALVMTAQYDVLRDEGIQYAKRLEEEGGGCVWKHYRTAFHGICNMPYSLVRRGMINDICSFVNNFI
ncbi:unnamed protein product [Nippostrongylus brasiliensis]|uniref:Arylacetamide deacetylase-like n=1 Tax=Nippostrongylus brasiliensis TaxID=27835 RepID=A0A0N4XVP9_NIPBR|nr:hypothetical protein Q1695_000795 [Nippostrongylus brasiliensis]VDL70485.1 unnamed protein product [Nippostrongylus brasiliensis]